MTSQLNVRNVDPELWREVRAEAERRGVSPGQLLNTILIDWLGRREAKGPTTEELAPEEAAEIVRRTRGMFAHLAPGRSLVDELIAERREEFRRELEGQER